MSFRNFRYNQGFTLIELVTVLIILGIISVVGSAKFFNNSTFKDARYHQEILSAFRFAQKIAIASQNKVTICLTSTSYTLYYSSAACSGTNVQHPAKQGGYKDTATSTINPVANYTFSADGNVSSSTGVYSFTIGPGHSIKIESVTGYVHE
ncbi:MAG: type II secretion system GspH family protein [gamma proteobacterium symbiont of Taylorina sp.]|nr:type II secretion system GspH family protein [gamma proteobacterium symbiont of Taylorina sp.]